MAKGDVKYSRGRGGGGGGSAWSYNDDAYRRENSKQWLDYVKSVDNPCAYLKGLADDKLVRMYSDTHYITRYGKYDWDRIVEIIGEQCGREVFELYKAAKVRENERRAQRDRENQERWRIEREEAAKAKEIKIAEEVRELRQDADLTSGLLQSDFHNAFTWKEKFGRYDGDYLDDPVDAYTTGAGFAEEVRERAGVKLQITLSLDLSNSMWYNQIASDAVRAFITLGVALEDLKEQFAGSLFTHGFLYAMWEDGKGAQALGQRWSGFAAPDDDPLNGYGRMREYIDSYVPSFAGQDTWVCPLFERIEKWENEESDPGAVRLDLIITDGVLEHVTDIRAANVVQERRDGALQSVFLNFLPEEDWVSVTMPFHCVQYPIHKDNLAGLLRQLISQFASVYA